jgi:4'-phosphopantetheinyl transferase
MMQPAAKLLTAAAPEALLASPAHATAEPDTVHVWAFDLEAPETFVALCRSVLSDEERHRADRFVFERDRIHYTVAHAVLRHLLSRYCDQNPGSLRFSITPSGKPALLTGTGDASPICFNLTHSEDRAMLAVSAGRELGVDLEKVRSNIEALAISRHYFFGSEREAIEKAPPEERDNVFFRYWVAKEAVLKAQGVGLGFPLDRFRVDFLPGGDRARIETLDPDRLDGAWTVRMLPSQAGWPAAVAARGEDWDVALEG